MKKSSIISIVFGILVFGAVIFALNNKANAPESDIPTKPSSSMESNNNQSGQDLGNKHSLSSGKYIEYSEANLASAQGDKVLFFHAPWCAQCRSIEAGIKEQGVPDGLTIIKVDYDSNQELRNKYGVTLQTTFVKLDDQNNATDKYVAYGEPTFDAVKRNFLKS